MLYVPGVIRQWRRLPRARRLLGTPLLPLRWLSRRLKRRRFAASVTGGTSRVVLTGTLNGRGMTDDLRRLQPDVLVLAHCGLVAPEVIEIARDGVVNVHPGLLPWIRGNSPLGNSLIRRIPLGCTAFRVDAGIDTGRILIRRLLPIRGGETMAELRDALHRQWVEMTADLVAAAHAGEIGEGFAQEGRFPLCRTLAGADDERAVDEAVRDKEPRVRFEIWRALCDPADLSLAAGAAVVFAPPVGE